MFGPYWGIPTGLLSGQTAAIGFALINGFGVLGGVVGPSLMGFIGEKQDSFGTGLIALGASVLLSGVITLQLRRILQLRQFEDIHYDGPSENVRTYMIVEEDDTRKTASAPLP